MSQITNNEEQRPEIFQAVEHLFRHEAAKIVATLTGIFGIEHLTLAEDVVQEALARALQTWPFYGVPRNPAAWIMRTARNLAFVGLAGLGRTHAVEALTIVRRRQVCELVLAGTIIGERAKDCPVGQRQRQVGGGPDGERRALIVG
jgi:DNA-directed RNA polymerase specialized sigma24 family protein